MRNIAISILLLLLSFDKVYSQKYRSFDSTTVWGAEYAFKVNTNCYMQHHIKYFIKGYSVNNGNTWLKVFSGKTANWDPLIAGNCGPLGQGYSVNLIGYLYNDTLNKRVYFDDQPSPNFSISSNKLLYDFNKVVGDTMYVVMPNSWANKLKIDAIDSVLFSGKYHKRFFVTAPAIPALGPLSITEGIGSSIDPFSPVKAIGFESSSALVCFSSPIHSLSVSNHTVFTNGGCNNLVLTINESSKIDFTIYPNPASDKLSIVGEQFVSEKTDYELINLVGQVKLKGQLKEGNNEVNLQNLSAGIYFIYFYKDHSIISSKKIIISQK